MDIIVEKSKVEMKNEKLRRKAVLPEYGFKHVKKVYLSITVSQKSKVCSSYLFFKIGVSLGSKSLIGGVILFIPITFTMDCLKR